MTQLDLGDGYFSLQNWERLKAARQSGIVLLLSPACLESLQADDQHALREVVDLFASCIAAESPGLQVVGSQYLGDHEFEILAGGELRLAGALNVDRLDWWLRHPAAGGGGRTGAFAIPVAGEVSMAMIDVLGRALEEVLFDDPSLLLSGSASAITRELARRRVPVESTAVLRAAKSVEPPADEVAEVEQMACQLRTYRVSITLGSELHRRLRPHEEGSTLNVALVPEIRRELFRDLGVAYPAFSFEMGEDLQEGDYRIAVNGFPRAAGRIPLDRTLIDCPFGGLPPGAEPCVNPFSGDLDGWLDNGSLIDFPSRPPELLIADQIKACLLEAASEFSDLAWSSTQLKHLAEAGYAQLVDLARTMVGEERVAATLERLLADGFSMRALPRILDNMVLASPRAPERPDAGRLASRVRIGMRDYVAYRYRHDAETAESSSGWAKVRHVIRALDILPEQEDALRRLSSDPGAREARQHVARSVLRHLEKQLAGGPASPLPALVTSADLRPQLRRLVSAQFPRMAVLAREELGSEESRVLLTSAAS